MLNQALKRISPAEFNMDRIVGSLLSVIMFIEDLLHNRVDIVTDMDTKAVITENIMDVVNNLYLEIGKYYTDKEFDYSIKLEPLLNRVIEKCLVKGYYFGESV